MNKYLKLLGNFCLFFFKDHTPFETERTKDKRDIVEDINKENTKHFADFLFPKKKIFNFQINKTKT